jgi:hypothetical protein
MMCGMSSISTKSQIRGTTYGLVKFQIIENMIHAQIKNPILPFVKDYFFISVPNFLRWLQRDVLKKK